MRARFIEHNTNEDVKTRLEDYETEFTFGNGNTKDGYAFKIFMLKNLEARYIPSNKN